MIQVEGSIVAKPWGETGLACSRNKKMPSGCRGRKGVGHLGGQVTLESRISGSDFVSGEYGDKSLEGHKTGYIAPLRP